MLVFFNKSNSESDILDLLLLSYARKTFPKETRSYSMLSLRIFDKLGIRFRVVFLDNKFAGFVRLS